MASVSANEIRRLCIELPIPRPRQGPSEVDAVTAVEANAAAAADIEALALCVVVVVRQQNVFARQETSVAHTYASCACNAPSVPGADSFAHLPVKLML